MPCWCTLQGLASSDILHDGLILDKPSAAVSPKLSDLLPASAPTTASSEAQALPFRSLGESDLGSAQLEQLEGHADSLAISHGLQQGWGSDTTGLSQDGEDWLMAGNRTSVVLAAMDGHVPSS